MNKLTPPLFAAALLALLLPVTALAEDDAQQEPLVFEAPPPLFPAPAYRCSDAFNRDNPICAGGLEMPRAELEAYRTPVLRAIHAVVAQLPGATIMLSRYRKRRAA